MNTKNIVIVVVVAIVFGIAGFFIGKGVMNNQQAALYRAVTPTPSGYTFTDTQGKDGTCTHIVRDAGGNTVLSLSYSGTWNESKKTCDPKAFPKAPAPTVLGTPGTVGGSVSR